MGPSTSSLNSAHSDTLDDTQQVWKRIFDHVMERTDVYLRTAVDKIHAAHADVHAEDDYAGLVATCNALTEERERLTQAVQDAPVTAGLISQANGYEARTRGFCFHVQRTLEDVNGPQHSPLSSYRFPPEASDVHGSETALDQGAQRSSAGSISPTDSSGHVYYATGPQAQDNFAHSALGLYTFRPLGALPTFGGPLYDEPQEMRSSASLVRRQPGQGTPVRSDSSRSSLCTPFSTLEIAPLNLRTFPLRTRDTLEEERAAMQAMVITSQAEDDE